MVAVSKELSLRFVSFYDPAEFADALSAIANGTVDWRVFVTGTVPLDEVPQAFEALRDPDAHTKILIKP